MNTLSEHDLFPLKWVSLIVFPHRLCIYPALYVLFFFYGFFLLNAVRNGMKGVKNTQKIMKAVRWLQHQNYEQFESELKIHMACDSHSLPFLVTHPVCLSQIISCCTLSFWLLRFRLGASWYTYFMLTNTLLIERIGNGSPLGTLFISSFPQPARRCLLLRYADLVDALDR